MAEEFDLAKLRHLQRQRDSLQARRHALAELRQSEMDAERFARDNLAAQFRQAQARGLCVGATFDDIVDWTDAQMRDEGLSTRMRVQWQTAAEAAEAYAAEIAEIDAQARPLVRLVAACERLVPGDALHMPAVLKGA